METIVLDLQMISYGYVRKTKNKQSIKNDSMNLKTLDKVVSICYDAYELRETKTMSPLIGGSKMREIPLLGDFEGCSA